MNTILTSLFDYTAWADKELMSALCEPVAPALEQGHHKAIRLMNHIHVVDKIFIAHLTGAQHGYTATNTPETPTPEQLSWDMAETAAWLQQYVAQIDSAALNESVAFTFTDGDKGCMTRLEMLLHLHAHATYHRGQVSQMLKDMGLTPPRELLTRKLHTQEPQRRSR